MHVQISKRLPASDVVVVAWDAPAGFLALHATHSEALDLLRTQQILHSHSSADFLNNSARLGWPEDSVYTGKHACNFCYLTTASFQHAISITLSTHFQLQNMFINILIIFISLQYSIFQKEIRTHQ